MRSRVAAGMVAGILAGIVFGFMMQAMGAPAPDGSRMPMMAMVAQVVRSNSLAVGWIYHLFNSAVIGAIFGWTLGDRVAARPGPGAGWGALYGLVWWILGGLILMPVLLGMHAFAPLKMPPMRPVAMGSLIGHIVFGLILGTASAWLRGRASDRIPPETRPVL
jgi:uncharacterized membrane protein YagU involved in acid resistance